MNFVTLVTINNEIVVVFECDPATEQPNRKVTQYTCKDGSAAYSGGEFLLFLFEDNDLGSGLFNISSDRITAALSFYLNTNHLINTIETGNVNPLKGQDRAITPGLNKVRGETREKALQWLKDHPNEELSTRHAAKQAGVTYSTMRRAMLDTDRMGQATR